ncbi:MAG: DNA repair protein RecN [Bacteroidia bacterium]|nr:DNA repair protein RecN [Bacteroidia bacterium]MCX7652979.1 DNA repair protein RecN [Bacteroidia bacterium]
MLLRLSIHNLALFREADLILEPGLNILTGETGAGKSLLVESLNMLLGYKAELPPLVSKAVIEAVFAPIPEAFLAHLLEPAEELVLRCELSASGRRRLFLNDSLISAQTLRELSYYLVEIHSQHESQQLFQPHFQRELLDNYAELTQEVRAYQQLYKMWQEKKAQLADLQKNHTERSQRIAWLTTQLEELQNTRLSTEEYIHLETQIRRIEHQAQIIQTLSYWLHQLSESPHAPSALLKEATKSISKLPLPETEAILSDIESARAALNEAIARIETLLSEVSIDSEEVEKIRLRYDQYNSLLLKYRLPTVEALIEMRDRLQAEYNRLNTAQESLAPLQAEVDALTQALLEKAYRLELARLAAAQSLSDHVQTYLAELGLGYAHFQIAVERLTDTNSPYTWDGQHILLTPYGFSDIAFLLRTAPNFPLAPLSQVASGGELSRIMLALKAALGERVELPTLVLDEIDTGLSGEGARRMGEFLARLSRRFQIILITHLPAIAAQPGAHFYIWKEPTPEGWHTQIRRLSPNERIHEIARMLSGEAAGDASLAAAQELLKSSAK